MKIREHAQRFLWGRTRAESEAQARREAWQRFERDVDRARREGLCYVVHAPEIYAGYCEVHRRPVFAGRRCA